MEMEDVGYPGRMRCGAPGSVKRGLPGLLLAFDFLFFFNVSFESHWLEVRDDKASYLTEYPSSSRFRRVTGGDIIHSTLLRKDLFGFSL